jgi:ABC-type uncharacterized transport system substrate-binding protein
VSGIRRRDFVILLGGAAAAWPLAARAQQGHRRLTVGVLGESTASDASTRSTAFQQRLRELGWIEGSTIAIEYRWAEGRRERFAEIADELVRLKVDIIVTVGGAVPILKQATSVIPIVFTIDADPVGRGLVRFALATRWQRHGSLGSADRPGRQAARVVARACSRAASTGGAGQ